MIEHSRYQRALVANTRDRDPPGRSLQVFLDQEFKTQFALTRLEMTINDSPKRIPHIDQTQIVPELINERTSPYVIEILGMPKAGKSTSISRFLEQSWTSGHRQRIRLVQEGVRTVPEEYKYLKYDELFSFHLLAGTASLLGLFETVRDIGQFEILLQDRGMFDRRVFRRAMFLQGKVNPGIMETEKLWQYGLESPPFPIGGLIICLIKPETSLIREGPREKPGTVMNLEFLNMLYEQYLRFHYEILNGKLLVPTYACLNMECSEEEGFVKFNNVLAQIIDAQHHLKHRGLNKK